MIDPEKPINTITRIGTWVKTGLDIDICGSGINIGGSLFLPAAGYHNYSSDVAIINRGSIGKYWTGTQVSTNERGYVMEFTSGTLVMGGDEYNDKYFGNSVRCISEAVN
ncbi:TPA: hypothetical protein ACWX1I_003256 [Elizabethkingia anophelis]